MNSHAIISFNVLSNLTAKTVSFELFIRVYNNLNLLSSNKDARVCVLRKPYFGRSVLDLLCAFSLTFPISSETVICAFVVPLFSIAYLFKSPFVWPFYNIHTAFVLFVYTSAAVLTVFKTVFSRLVSIVIKIKIPCSEISVWTQVMLLCSPS